MITDSSTLLFLQGFHQSTRFQANSSCLFSWYLHTWYQCTYRCTGRVPSGCSRNPLNPLSFEELPILFVSPLERATVVPGRGQAAQNESLALAPRKACCFPDQMPSRSRESGVCFAF